MNNSTKGCVILLVAAFSVPCFAQNSSSTRLDPLLQERAAKEAQYSQGVDKAASESEKTATQSGKYFQKQLEQMQQKSDQPSDSTDNQTTENTDENNTEVTIPNCDNCNDPKYNYHSNFLYDSKGNKIERLYPSRCKCVETAPEPVVTPNTNEQSPAQTSTNWGIKY